MLYPATGYLVGITKKFWRAIRTLQRFFLGSHRAFLLGAYTLPLILTFNSRAPGVLLQQGVSGTRPWG